MSDQQASARKRAHEQLHALQGKSKSEPMRNRLGLVAAACESLVGNEVDLTITAVIKWIAGRSPGTPLSAQTIYNARNGDQNPYRIVIDAWKAVAHAGAPARRTRPTSANSNELIDESEIRDISDPVTRHKVAILVAQIKALKNQIEMRRAVHENPKLSQVLQPSGEPQSSADTSGHLDLSVDERAAVCDFLRAENLKRRGLSITESGVVKMQRVTVGQAITKPGFASALQKVARLKG